MSKEITIPVPDGKRAEWINGVLTLVDEQKVDNRPVTERIKTLADAMEALGQGNPLVEEYIAVRDKLRTDAGELIAYLKLRIIVAALNEGWEPKFTKDEYRYFPCFYFYTKEEWEDKTDHPFPLISWSEVRGHMRELIRGKKAPASLSIVLQLRPDMMEQMLTAEGYPQLRDNIGAMVLNIRYDGKEVTLVTGIALKSFTLDRNADRIWDEAMGRFLASCEIGYETQL